LPFDYFITNNRDRQLPCFGESSGSVSGTSVDASLESEDLRR